MGDPSHEPSMEDILASIKRIIAEDGEGAPAGRRGRAQRAVATPEPDAEDDGVLELTQRVEEVSPPAIPPSFGTDVRQPEPAAAEPDLDDSDAFDPSPVAEAAADPNAASTPRPFEEEPAMAEQASVGSSQDEAAADETPLVSAPALAASRQSIAQLSNLLVKSDNAGPGTLEALVRDMLRPMLKEWLDARLPGLVEQVVHREIARIVEGR